MMKSKILSIEIKEATIVAMMFDLMIPRYQEEDKLKWSRIVTFLYLQTKNTLF